MKPLAATQPAASAQPLVTLRGAGVSFGSHLALQHIDLALERGDRLALIGPNGSGKTTLLRLLHGMHGGRSGGANGVATGAGSGARSGAGQGQASGAGNSAEYGALSTAGVASGERIVHALAPEARPFRAAMVFQRPFLLELSVRLNVLIALWLAGVPAEQRSERCRRALERVGLGRVARRRARELSAGQQQRLALARAWAPAPDILFLDEPTASLDPGAKREVEALIGEFAHDATLTLVMSTHNLGQAKRLATRVACLEGGRLLADLPAQRFFDDGAELPEPVRQFLRGELPWTT